MNLRRRGSIALAAALTLSLPTLPAAGIRLGTWTLDDLSPGPEILSATNVQAVTGLAGQAARLNAPGTPAWLRCATSSADGHRRLALSHGTVQFAFRPDWSTATGGPGHPAVLFQAGATGEAGAWILRVDATGSALEWVRHDGHQDILLNRAPAQFTSNVWYALSLTYGPAGAQWFTNGVPVVSAVNRPSPALPDPASLPNGFLVGSDSAGGQQAAGTLDELEAWDQALDPVVVRADLQGGLRAEVQADPPGIALRWRVRPGQPLALSRRRNAAEPWTLLTRTTNLWSWVDREGVPGHRYQYLLRPTDTPNPTGDRYLETGIELPPRHDRGVVLVLVDRTLVRSLRPELATLERDLVDDGWQPALHEVPRHDDVRWSNNPPAVAQVKALVDAAWTSHGDRLRAIYLIGHAPIPHSGDLRPDGHHSRPLPADGYYGDTVRGTNDWTDTQSAPPTADPRSRAPGFGKHPHDGIFDPHTYPSAVEVGVGRVDFAGLSQLTGGELAGEVRLLKGYLRKTARYRRGQLTFLPEAGFSFQPAPSSDPVDGLLRVRRNTSAWFGPDAGLLRLVDFFHATPAEGLLLGVAYGYGGYDARAPGHSSLAFRTRDLAVPGRDPRVGFYLVDGSYLGDWGTVPRSDKNTLTRALLAPANSGLAAMWARVHTGRVSFQTLGLGDSLGEAWAQLISRIDPRDPESGMGSLQLSLLGDPTLRLFVLPPAEELQAREVESGVEVRWAPAAGADGAWHVYRSGTGPDGPFECLTSAPVTARNFHDQAPLRGRAWYQVRPTGLTVTGAGSFHNLGLGRTTRARK